MLPRSQRLLKFQEIYKDGRAARGKFMTLRFIKKQNGDTTRIGFAVARLVKSKVMKNRLKRRLRSICRRRLVELRDKLDIVVNIFGAATTASFEELEQDFVRVAERAGLFRDLPQE